MTTAQPSSAHPASAENVAEFARTLTPDTTWEIGLMPTNHCSQPGMDSTGTNALDRNVKGKRIIIEMPCTPWAERTIVPTYGNAQDRDHPVMMTRTMAAATPMIPPPGRYPIAMPTRNVMVAAIP